MPKLGASENPRLTTGFANDGKVDRVLKVIPTGGCYLRVQRERMLGAVGGVGAADPSRTSWVPNFFDDTPRRFDGDPLATLRISLTAPHAKGIPPKPLTALAIALSGVTGALTPLQSG
jgi:hypothetical protein